MQMPEFQYIYRRDVGEGKALDSVEVEGGGECCLYCAPWSLVWHLGGWIRAIGFAGVIKAAVKLMTPRRLLYSVSCGSEIAHYGWITQGKCKYYPVETDAVVIGPVETVQAFRGRGLATRGLAFVLRAMAGKGCPIFYIDTADTNYPMQRVIEKCGFGKPVNRYARQSGELE